MKRIQANLVLLCFCAVLSSCASLEQNAYRTIGAWAITVDGAMNVWGDYVRSGMAKPDDEAYVKRGYETYQAAMHVARDAITAYKTHADDAALNSALDNVNYSVIALTEEIRHFLPPEKAKMITPQKANVH